jgi:hypothetical protein
MKTPMLARGMDRQECWAVEVELLVALPREPVMVRLVTGFSPSLDSR